VSKRLHIFVDGACRGNPGPASVGVFVQTETGESVKEYHRTLGVTTNNVAEYAAMEDALKLAEELGGTDLKIHADSQLVVRQLNGEYKIKNPALQEFAIRIGKLRQRFASVEIVHVRRELNKRADRLANTALDLLKKKPTSVG
jgi:ribonuclease HI